MKPDVQFRGCITWTQLAKPLQLSCTFSHQLWAKSCCPGAGRDPTPALGRAKVKLRVKELKTARAFKPNNHDSAEQRRLLLFYYIPLSAWKKKTLGFQTFSRKTKYLQIQKESSIHQASCCISEKPQSCPDNIWPCAPGSQTPLPTFAQVAGTLNAFLFRWLLWALLYIKVPFIDILQSVNKFTKC